MYWSNSFTEIFLLKTLVVEELSPFSGMENDALLHREGLKGYYQVELQLLGMKWVHKLHKLHKIFNCLVSNKAVSFTHLKLWVALARHHFHRMII